MGESGGDAALREARETIARQQQEIERLRRRLEDERLAEDLRDAVATAAATARIAAPSDHTRLLRVIIEAAAQVISARAGALLVVDREAQELVFEVAVGGSGQEIERTRLPLGHGIAGLVAVTGQPMAVADAENDPRQARDVAERVGYVPRNILCVPLYNDDEVVGVLELLDKEGAPSFGADDMGALSHFVRLAGIALDQSRNRHNVVTLLSDMLGAPAGDGADLLESRIRAFAEHQSEDPSFGATLDLARLVRQVAARGGRELELCRAILRSFAGYLDEQSADTAELSAWE